MSCGPESNLWFDARRRLRERRVGVGGLFRDTHLDDKLKMIALNCSGTIQLAKYVVQQMHQGSGRILLTASIAGEMVAPREGVYAATKAFVLSFAHSLNYELRDANITVTALQPGPTDTDFFHRAGMDNTRVGQEGKSESQPEDVVRQGLDALFAGKVPGTAKGAMHEKMAKPIQDTAS